MNNLLSRQARAYKQSCEVESADAYYRAARLYEKAGKLDDAQRCRKKAKELTNVIAN